MTRLSDFIFSPGETAAEPVEPRDAAKLLVVHRAENRLEHRRFKDLPDYLKAGDCLVLNRTKVLPARLFGKKPTGGQAELLILSPWQDGAWLALSQSGKPGLVLSLSGEASATFLERTSQGEWIIRLSVPDVPAYLESHGETPLPPYILKARKAKHAQAQDRDRYQTVYAKAQGLIGSIAAPTAGLHFTTSLLKTLRERGVRLATITLHIGWGTFRPVTVERVEEHRMLPEPFEVDAEAAQTLKEARARGKRIVPVGTSSTRTLESLSALEPKRGLAEIFISPGHAFRHVDALITNFHLPASTPLLLACAFAGRERLLGAYREAVQKGYRFYSYGDACLVL